MTKYVNLDEVCVDREGAKFNVYLGEIISDPVCCCGEPGKYEQFLPGDPNSTPGTLADRWRSGVAGQPDY